MVALAALEAFGLSKRYGDRQAVAGVDLVVRPGEIHGLLGPNGAGKTTLLRMLLGLVRPDAGTVHLLGHRAAGMGAALPEGAAGYVDTPGFYPYLSGRRNLDLLARLDEGSSRAAGVVSDVDAALRDVDLASHAEVKVSAYSAGMRQRLGLAALLIRTPRLLLLDEPTSSLDPAGVRAFHALVRRLAHSGAAVLLSSHDMAEVASLCGSLTVVHHGRVVFSGTVSSLREAAPSPPARLSTANDEQALSMAALQSDVRVTRGEDGAGLDVVANEEALDRYSVALGVAGIAIRRLERREHSLESLFLGLTSDAPRLDQVSTATEPAAPDSAASASDGVSVAGIRAVVAVECTKLRTQAKSWVTLGVCAIAPVVFVLVLKVDGRVPEDTLFGRWALSSGFAVPLVVLGFAPAWVLPALTSVIAGDLFSSEDRYGTWSTLLTRGRRRSDVFVGKVLTAFGFSLLVVAVLALSSIAAGVLVIGRAPLLGLSGIDLPASQALSMVALAWATVLSPVLGFTSLAMLVSVVTRSSVAGVGLPVALGFVMDLSSLVVGAEVARRLLLTSSFDAWHGLFTSPHYYGPLVQGAVVSVLYMVGCLAYAQGAIRRRDMGS